MGNGTSIGRVRGLGPAHAGTHHWLLQRFTAASNLLLIAYLAVSLLLLPDLGHATVSGWLSGAVPAAALALLTISVFWHARLGLQVLIEDYVHAIGPRFAAVLLLNLFAFGGAGFGLLSIARLAFGGAA